MKEHELSRDCWCNPEIITVPNKLDVAFDDYTKGKISFERLAETIGVNFYTLHSAFLKFRREK